MPVSVDSPVDDHLKASMVYPSLLRSEPNVYMSRCVSSRYVLGCFPPETVAYLALRLSCLSHCEMPSGGHSGAVCSDTPHALSLAVSGAFRGRGTAYSASLLLRDLRLVSCLQPLRVMLSCIVCMPRLKILQMYLGNISQECDRRVRG